MLAGAFFTAARLAAMPLHFTGPDPVGTLGRHGTGPDPVSTLGRRGVRRECTDLGTEKATGAWMGVCVWWEGWGGTVFSTQTTDVPVSARTKRMGGPSAIQHSGKSALGVCIA